jgi:hypothetical protein
VIRLLDVPGRVVWYVPGTAPACFLFVDERAGGILVNSPPYRETLASEVLGVAPVRFIFYPSRLGAADVEHWRDACGARTLAAAEEVRGIAGPIDEPIDGSVRLYGRLDFLPLSGRTQGTCAMRSRLAPELVFFGPALEHAPWPALALHEDDHSAENRLIGAIGLCDERFEFAFCDNYIHGESRFGPGASTVVADGIEKLLAT